MHTSFLQSVGFRLECRNNLAGATFLSILTVASATLYHIRVEVELYQIFRIRLVIISFKCNTPSFDLVSDLQEPANVLLECGTKVGLGSFMLRAEFAC